MRVLTARNSTRLVVLDTNTGKPVADLAISGNTDDLFYDSARADDGRTASRRLADHSLWMGTRRPVCPFVFFTLFPVSLLFADNFTWLAFAFVIRGLKEFGEPARKALIIAQASPELRARTYGAYYLIRDCIVTIGSFLGAWLWSISPQREFHRCGPLRRTWRPMVRAFHLFAAVISVLEVVLHSIRSSGFGRFEWTPKRTPKWLKRVQWS
jgi:MFS family permease